MAANADRHDGFLPACAVLPEGLAADPPDRTSASIRKGNAIAGTQILDRPFTAIREDPGSPQEALRTAAATTSAGTTAPPGASMPAGTAVSTRATVPPTASQCT